MINLKNQKEVENTSERWETSPSGMDKAENDWWLEFADVEEEYCWVQTPELQKFLRGNYISKIAQALSPTDKVLEFGCGTGWLSVLLAESGVNKLYAVDFSAEQIRRAKILSQEKGLTEKIQFILLKDSLENLKRQFPETKFDALVIHGVLHHLTIKEINDLFDFCKSILSSKAKVFILEPIVSEEKEVVSKTDKIIQLLIGLPMRGQKSGWRKNSPQEKMIQEKIIRRNIGIHPRGPSPKEMPFQKGEVEKLLEKYLIFAKSESVLFFSYHVAKNLLLFQLSYPKLGKIIMKPYLWLTRMIERRFLQQKNLDTQFSIFELFEAKIKKP